MIQDRGWIHSNFKSESPISPQSVDELISFDIAYFGQFGNQRLTEEKRPSDFNIETSFKAELALSTIKDKKSESKVQKMLPTLVPCSVDKMRRRSSVARRQIGDQLGSNRTI